MMKMDGGLCGAVFLVGCIWLGVQREGFVELVGDRGRRGFSNSNLLLRPH